MEILTVTLFNFFIQPFYPVVTFSRNRGRGVVGECLVLLQLTIQTTFLVDFFFSYVGVLEANFIEPTHSKQDFEKTNVFQKLVTRLKDMTHEYWCDLATTTCFMPNTVIL